MVYYANKMIQLGVKMNIQKLRAIFESSGSLRRLHMPQEYMVLESYLGLGMIHLESNNLEPFHHGLQEQLIGLLDTMQPWEETAVVRTIPPLAAISNGGGRAHTLLCWSAAAWLIDQKYQVLAEQRYNGRRVDLITPCHTWLIECGDTSPQPIPKHLLRGVQYIGIVPFQESDPANLEMLVFSKGDSWNKSTIRNNLVIDFTNEQ